MSDYETKCQSPEDNPGYATCDGEKMLCEICELESRIAALEAEVEEKDRALQNAIKGAQDCNRAVGEAWEERDALRAKVEEMEGDSKLLDFVEALPEPELCTYSDDEWGKGARRWSLELDASPRASSDEEPGNTFWGDTLREVIDSAMTDEKGG